MFWRRNKTGSKKAAAQTTTFAEAKEATRRATFLNLAPRMTSDDAYRQQMLELFQVCRAKALAVGAAEGRSEAEIDGAIAALCDADVARLKEASDEEFREFARESGEIVKRFLSTI
jgi:hypothetical protein